MQTFLNFGCVPKPKRLSHSACEVLESCELHYLFDQRMKLESEPRLEDLALSGKIVHDIIPAVFESISTSNLSNVEDYHNFLLSKVSLAMEVSTTQPTTQKVADITTTCLENFIDFMEQRLNFLNDRGMLESFLPINTESWLNATIGGAPFTGRLDAVFSDIKLWAIDWKTSSNTSITPSIIKQAVRYTIMYKEKYRTQLDSFYIVNLRAPINLKKCKITITPSMISEEEQLIKDLWERANGSVFRKMKSYEACLFCDHKIRCARTPDIIDLESNVDGWI